MARTPAKKAKPAKKAAKKAAPKKSPAKKAARKAPARKAAARKSSPPEHHLSAAHRAQLQARVGRPRKGEHHEDQVVPMAVEAQIPVAPADSLHGNYGDAKARSVARQDNPTNWFRQAPKPKAK